MEYLEKKYRFEKEKGDNSSVILYPVIVSWQIYRAQNLNSAFENAFTKFSSVTSASQLSSKTSKLL